jgi:hypothetical protein
MISGSLAVFFILLLLSGHGGAQPSPAPSPLPPGPRPPTPPPGPVRPASDVVPAPWPQVVPAGLPPFPSNGWVPDSPPPAAVQTRARALLPQLWGSGAGTFKTEQTGGRWIVYQAAPTKRSDGTITKGVVAFREAAPSSSPASPAANTFASTSSTPPIIARTVRKGSSGPDVAHLQSLLGVPSDGSFGPGTDAAVRAFQTKHGLTPDGVVGPATWSALGSGVRA